VGRTIRASTISGPAFGASRRLPDAPKVIRATAEASSPAGVYAINDAALDEANN
jgi:hypothetical protein